MKKLTYGLLLCALVVGMAVATPTHAQATTTDTGIRAELMAKIADLQSQLANLRAQIAAFLHARGNGTSTEKVKDNHGDQSKRDDNNNDDCLPPGILHAPGIAKRLENGKGLPPGLLKLKKDCQPGHGDHGHATSTPPTATSTPDIIAPQITFATSLNVTASTSRLIWVTNEAADSRVWTSTSSPVATTSATAASNSTLTFYHDLTLTGLATSTQYFYTVGSADASSNLGILEGKSFTTLAL